ncbi:MAG: DUF192 domain-containing protein [Myxococcota bacterium]
MRYRVTNLTRNTLLADRAARADSFLSRFKGLMGVAALPLGEGLQIEPCTSIHTFFMRIPIDALFLDKDLTVVDICHALPPWRVSRVYFGARSVLELPAGTAAASQTQPGDRLAMTPLIDAKTA